MTSPITIKYDKINSFLNKYTYKDIEIEIIKKYLSSKNIQVKNSKIIQNYILQQNNIINLDNIFIYDIKDIERYFELLVSSEDRKNNGAFFTPEHIVKYMVDHLSPKENDKNLDPACGCGAFLIELIEFYREKFNKSIKDIIRDNIYGVDIQQINIDRSKIILALYALENNEILEEEDFNLKCADALLCDWNSLFDVHEFDNIIGNPPYISREYGLFQSKEKDYEQRFTCIKGIYDTFALFVELSISLLKTGGKNSFILPTTFFVNDSFELIRKEFLKYDILLLKLIDEFVFDNVIVPTGIYVLKKSSELSEVTIYRKEKIFNISKQLIVGEKNIIKVDIDFEFAEKIQKYEKYIKTKLSDYLEIKESIKTGNDKKFVSKEITDEHNIPLLKGKHIDRFQIKGNEYLAKNVHSLKRNISSEIFELPKKLYIRRVSNKIICALDTNKYYAVHTLYFAILKDKYKKFTSLYEILELLLNSDFYSKVYTTKYPFKGKLFPEIRINKLRSLIMPDINVILSYQDKLLEIKNKIISEDENSCYYDDLDSLIIEMFEQQIRGIL